MGERHPLGGRAENGAGPQPPVAPGPGRRRAPSGCRAGTRRILGSTATGPSGRAGAVLEHPPPQPVPYPARCEPLGVRPAPQLVALAASAPRTGRRTPARCVHVLLDADQLPRRVVPVVQPVGVDQPHGQVGRQGAGSRPGSLPRRSYRATGSRSGPGCAATEADPEGDAQEDDKQDHLPLTPAYRVRYGSWVSSPSLGPPGGQKAAGGRGSGRASRTTPTRPGLLPRAWRRTGPEFLERPGPAADDLVLELSRRVGRVRGHFFLLFLEPFQVSHQRHQADQVDRKQGGDGGWCRAALVLLRWRERGRGPRLDRARLDRSHPWAGYANNGGEITVCSLLLQDVSHL